VNEGITSTVSTVHACDRALDQRDDMYGSWATSLYPTTLFTGKGIP
jgi:hypothetical protein